MREFFSFLLYSVALYGAGAVGFYLGKAEGRALGWAAGVRYEQSFRRESEERGGDGALMDPCKHPECENRPWCLFNTGQPAWKWDGHTPRYRVPRQGTSADWKLVVVESPYAGDVEGNLRYLRAALRDCLSRRESPYASHGLLTQEGVLDDLVPEERARGIAAGLAWGPIVDYVVFYLDRGFSRGMNEAFRLHRSMGRVIRTRYMGAPWSDIQACDALVTGV